MCTYEGRGIPVSILVSLAFTVSNIDLLHYRNTSIFKYTSGHGYPDGILPVRSVFNISAQGDDIIEHRPYQV